MKKYFLIKHLSPRCFKSMISGSYYETRKGDMTEKGHRWHFSSIPQDGHTGTHFVCVHTVCALYILPFLKREQFREMKKQVTELASGAGVRTQAPVDRDRSPTATTVLPPALASAWGLVKGNSNPHWGKREQPVRAAPGRAGCNWHFSGATRRPNRCRSDLLA